MSEPSAERRKQRRAQARSEFIKHLCICLLLFTEVLPIYMMMQISVKNNVTFNKNPFLPVSPWFPNLEEHRADFEERMARQPDVTQEERDKIWHKIDTSEWRWENYNEGIRTVAPYVANTVFVAISTGVVTLFFALMAAYFFSRYKMPGSTVLWAVFLFLMLMPGVASIVPLFDLLKELNLLNTLWALIIVYTAGGQVFNLYVLKNFIDDIPKDLFEAAEIDGASHFQQMMHIVVPMSGAILGTLAIFSFMSTWNEYMLPLIVLTDKDLFTLGVGLIYLDGEYVKRWGIIMSAFFTASIPLIIIFLFCMKLFIRGMAAGAIKG